MLADIARRQGILLCLDYDGTVSEITPAAASARPLKGIRTSIERIASASKQARVAIVSGRRIEEVKRLLGIDSGILFSGVHGLEFTDANDEASFVSEVAECAPELARVKQWLLRHMPDSRGFRIEDKVAAVGLHYRQADPSEAAELCGRFSEFVSAKAAGLKLVKLKMIDEAMPLAPRKPGQSSCSSAQAASVRDDLLRRRFHRRDAFAALGDDDVSVLIGAPRVTRAVYRLPDPAALALELSQLAEALTRADGRA